MPNLDFLSGLAGASKGASVGFGNMIDMLDRAKFERERYKKEQDLTDFRNSEIKYRNRRDTISDERDAALSIQSGKFRLRNVLDQAAGPVPTDRNTGKGPQLEDPNAPVQTTGPSPVRRALSMADIEPIPQSELDAEANKQRAARDAIDAANRGYVPKTKQDYIDVHRRIGAAGDATLEESRAALRDQRINNLKANHVSRAVAGAIGRLQATGVQNPTPQQIHAAATNELLANPEARKLFLPGGRASEYDQLRDEVWSGLQGRTDKLTHGKKPPTQWTPEGDEVTPAAAPAATTPAPDPAGDPTAGMSDADAWEYYVHTKGMSSQAATTAVTYRTRK